MAVLLPLFIIAVFQDKRICVYFAILFFFSAASQTFASHLSNMVLKVLKGFFRRVSDVCLDYILLNIDNVH